MKNLQMLIWLTQLGMSTAVPLAGFVLLAVWLKNCFGLGSWVVFVGIGLGIFSAVDGFLRNLKQLEQLGKDKNDKKPPASFNEHQ